MRRILLLLFVAVVFAAPIFRLGAVNINAVLLTIPITVFLLFSDIGALKFIHSFGLLKYLWLVFLFSLFHFLFNNAIDSYGLILSIYSIVVFYDIGIMVWFLKKHFESPFAVLLDTVNVIAGLNVFLSIALILSPSLIIFLNPIFVFNYASDLNLSALNRAYGVFSYGGAVQSIAYALLIIVNDQYSLGRKSIRILCSIFMIFGIFVSGRSGLFVIVVYALYRPFISDNILKSAIIVFLMLFSLYVLYLNIETLILNRQFGDVFYRAFEILYKFKTTGSFVTDSTDAIIHEHYAQDFIGSNLLLGDGNFGRNEAHRYIPSDSFYHRFLSGAGVLGTLLFLFSYFFLVKVGNRVNKFCFFIVFILLVLNGKEPVVLGVLGISHLIYIIYFLNNVRFRKKIGTSKYDFNINSSL